MQSLASPLTDSQRIQFCALMHEISCEVYRDLLDRFSEEKLQDQDLLSKRQFSELDGEMALLVGKVHEMALAQLNMVIPDHRLIPYLERQRMLIPVQHLDRLKQDALKMKQEYARAWEEFSEVRKDLRRIHEFVEEFNGQFHHLSEYRNEALELIASLRKETWLSQEGVPSVPKAAAVPAARRGLFELFRCNDPIIKEYALTALTELLEWDPIHMESAYHLIDLQTLLLEEIRAAKAQDLNTHLQRRLIKAYAMSIECILLHVGVGHLNAMADETKQQQWSGAEEIEGLNISKDPEIQFWAKYALQGIQYIKSDKSSLSNVMGRLGLITRAGIQIAIAVTNPEEAASLITGAFNDLMSSFHHIRWREKWFDQLLILKKLCRYCILDTGKFREISHIFKEKKNIKTDETLLYGIVSIIEYVILYSPVKEIREEAIKLLLHYFTIEIEAIRSRCCQAIEAMRSSGDPFLEQTGFGVYEMLVAAGKLPFDPGAKKIRAERRYIYENVLKFLLLRLAEIKGGFDVSGHSLVTLLCKSEEEELIPPLLKCLTQLCPDFQGPDPSGNTGFHVMIREKYLSTLRFITPEMQIDVNAQEHEQLYTALHDAVMVESSKAIKLLLKLRADPNLQDRQGNTPLHYAVHLNKKMVKVLLEGGADPNILNNEGETPLNIAIEKGYCQMILLLLSKEAKIAEEPQGITPIMLAAKKKNSSSLETLVKHKKAKLTQEEMVEVARYTESVKKSKRESNDFWQYHQRLKNSDRKYERMFSRVDPKGSNLYLSEESLLLPLISQNKSSHELEEALKAGANPNAVTRYGQTALHVAVRCGNRKAIRSLLRFGAVINQGDIDGCTPLHLAAFLRDAKSVELLLQQGADVHQKNDFGETPLLLACGTLLTRKPHGFDTKDVKSGREVQVLKKLIAAEASIEDKDPLGNNTLHRAVISGTAEIILYLHRNYPQMIWEKNAQGKIPAEDVLRFHPHPEKDPRILEQLAFFHDQFLVHTGGRVTLGNLLVINKKTELFRCLMEKRPELANFCDSTQGQCSPLHVAAKQGNEEILAVYLDKSLDLNHPDALGNTAAHLAAFYGHAKFLRRLRKSGADMRAKNRERRTPLHLAATRMDLKVIQACGAKSGRHEVDNRGDTALHIASRQGKEEIIEALWNPKLQVNDDGNTPLHEACLFGKEKAVRFFVQKGADIEARNAFGQTPLQLAAQEGRTSIVTFFLDNGANIWTQDDEEECLLHKAVFNHHYDVVARVLEEEKQLIRPTVEKLVKREDLFGETPLHELPKKAPKSGEETDLLILKELLKAGANPAAPSQQKETFLHIVASYGRVSLFHKLLELKPKTFLLSKDIQGNTPMHKAVLGKHPEMLRVLCGYKANGIEERNNRHHTPLLLALKIGFWEGARILIQNGANPEKRTHQNQSLFHLILDREKIDDKGYNFLTEAVQTFPKQLLITDKKGATPLHVLASRGHWAALFMLRFFPDNKTEGAKYVWQKNQQGLTAVDLADQNHHKKLAQKIRTFPLLSLGADYKDRTKFLTKNNCRSSGIS